MTGRELIKWIQDNNVEDLPVCADFSSHETELGEVEKAEIEIGGNDPWENEFLQGKKLIHIR